LQKKIIELKHQENKIIVRFTPGSSQIPVTAFLNNKINQNFVVDTGASTITIPTATAEKLGLNKNGTAPIQKLVTAGGMVEAPRVTLDAIELGGWVEYNVTAFILDMPNQSGLGLLGLNYLNRFRMDLNTKSGFLILEPR
jgi:aspartyl protease family protein